MIRFLLQCGPAFAQERAGLVEALDVPLSREEEWLGQGRGLFCKRNCALKGKSGLLGVVCKDFPSESQRFSGPLGWCGGGLQVKRSFQRDTVVS